MKVAWVEFEEKKSAICCSDKNKNNVCQIQGTFAV